jgi:hypothetical protein
MLEASGGFLFNLVISDKKHLLVFTVISRYLRQWAFFKA